MREQLTESRDSVMTKQRCATTRLRRLSRRLSCQFVAGRSIS